MKYENTPLDCEESNLQTELLEAARQGDIQRAHALIREGADVDKEMPLAAACYEGHLEMMRFLCAQGASLDLPYAAEITGGAPPLLVIASGIERLDIVSYLLQRTAVGKRAALDTAIERGNLSIFNALIDAGTDPFQGYSAGYLVEESALEMAAIHARLEMLQVLISSCAHHDEYAKAVYEALNAAILKSHINIIKYLALHIYSADFYPLDQTAVIEPSPLVCAVRVTDMRLIEYLSALGAGNLIEAFCEALRKGMSGVALYLLEKIENQQDITQLQIYDTHPVLAYAAVGGNQSVISYLLTKYGETLSTDGQLCSLYSHNIDSINLENQILPCRSSAISSSTVFVRDRYLPHRDITIDAKFVDMSSPYNSSLFHNRQFTIASQSDDIINRDSACTCVNSTDAAFLICMHFGHSHEAHLLLEHGFGIEAIDSDANNALIIATLSNNYHIAKLLIDKQINVNHSNKNGNTALHIAAALGILDIAELLINHGANTSQLNNEVESPVMLAQKYEHEDIVTLLDNLNFQ